jgi:murein DD-endopeptidase MepM/ murein hydrolase activator NlpD
MKKTMVWIIAVGIFLGIGIAAYRYMAQSGFGSDSRSRRVLQFIREPEQYADWMVESGSQCGDAPFLFPTTGMIGYVWNDSFRPGHHHTGIDIFGPNGLGQTPVYAVYDGYLTRLTGWKSSLILRIPDDPLHPGEQIWVYYTHLANPDGNSFIDGAFPEGTSEKFVAAGTLLGFQGNYSGNSLKPTGIHLHISIVESDQDGSFLNESEIRNTLDPSPYFGFPLTNEEVKDEIPRCP